MAYLTVDMYESSHVAAISRKWYEYESMDNGKEKGVSGFFTFELTCHLMWEGGG